MRSIIRSFCIALLIWIMLFGAVGEQAQAPLILGVDHIPVVVADLEKAIADYRAMGFAIKPGRPHADGIRNAHVKFPDGTEVELITASQAMDALTSEYRARLMTGEGPVYFGMYAPDHATLAAKLRLLHTAAQQDNGSIVFPADSPLHPLFFGSRNKAPTDRPEHFAHPNTAVRLSALWVRDSHELRMLLQSLNVPMTRSRSYDFIGSSMEIIDATLPEGHLYLVPSAATNVVAARIEVRSLAALEAVLNTNGVPMREYGFCHAAWVAPSSAHGIWLQFVEAGSASCNR
jgi:catechol 2,3-dioxygenase-like lactoylglutathione lyase family enzyme